MPTIGTAARIKKLCRLFHDAIICRPRLKGRRADYQSHVIDVFWLGAIQSDVGALGKAIPECMILFAAAEGHQETNFREKVEW